MSANDENKIMSSVLMDNSDAKADAVAGGDGGNGGNGTRVNGGPSPPGNGIPQTTF